MFFKTYFYGTDYKLKTPTQRIGVKYMASTLLVVMFPKDMEATDLSLDWNYRFF